MLRHCLNGALDVFAQGDQRFLQSSFRHRFRYAMMAGWRKSLSQEHLNPTVHPEEVVTVLVSLSVIAEEFDPLGQRVRNVHVPAVTPELRIFAPCHVVMKDDEVADANDLAIGLLIEAIAQGG